MTALITTFCIVVLLGILTALQIGFMAQRWAIKEAEFAKKWELSLAFEPKPFGFDPKGLLPSEQIDYLREIAETPTPGLDRLEAQLADTANDPEATDEHVLPTHFSLVVMVSIEERPESLLPLPFEFSELVNSIREAEEECGGRGLLLRKVELLGGNDAVLRFESVQLRGAEERLGKLANLLTASEPATQSRLHLAREKYTKVLAVVA